MQKIHFSMILNLAIIHALATACIPSKTSYFTDSGNLNTDTGTDTQIDDTSTTDTNSNDTSDANAISTWDIDSIDMLLQSGPYSVSNSAGTASVSSCTSGMKYTQFISSNTNSPTIILSHGFARGSGNMMDWGSHFSSYGFDVYVVDLCHASFFDANHPQNGEDLVEFSNSMNIAAPIFMGHSAGGLASVIAGSIHPDTLGVFGLDATNDGSSSGNSYAPSITAMSLELVGIPSDCNSQNNGVDLFKSIADSQIIRVTDADHCDFESPTDGLCTTFCSNNAASISDVDIQNHIKALSTAGLLWMTGLNASAKDLWTGALANEMLSNGSIEILQ